MAAPVLSLDDQPSRWGYVAAIVVSAIAHAGLVYLVVFVLPELLASPEPPPAAYTVKIVDSIPAGDLGTRLPALNRERARPRPPQRPAQTRAAPKPAPTPPPVNARNAIALNLTHPKATPTPTPPPAPKPTRVATPAPTAPPHPRRTPRPTPRATPRPTPRKRPKPQPKTTPKPKPRATPVAMAKRKPDVKHELEKVREQLLREHLAALKTKSRTAATPGGGPVVADRGHPGAGMGVGPGNGSAGIQQDPNFLLYYQQVQERIKNAWSFTGGNPDATATVAFGINPDGSLNSIKVAQSSRDPAFDDSVVRAIRGAGPFPPPPEKYRQQFAAGVEAVFKLSDLKASAAADGN